MSHPSNSVSIHPYFKAHQGKLDAMKAFLPGFIATTRSETKNLYYDFTLNDDELFCREAYLDADGLLEHLERVGPKMRELLLIADLTRVEIHGPVAELEKLKVPLAPLKPSWFAYHSGVQR